MSVAGWTLAFNQIAVVCPRWVTMWLAAVQIPSVSAKSMYRHCYSYSWMKALCDRTFVILRFLYCWVNSCNVGTITYVGLLIIEMKAVRIHVCGQRSLWFVSVQVESSQCAGTVVTVWGCFAPGGKQQEHSRYLFGLLALVIDGVMVCFDFYLWGIADQDWQTGWPWLLCSGCCMLDWKQALWPWMSYGVVALQNASKCLWACFLCLVCCTFW